MADERLFPEEYFQARARFRELASAVGGDLDSQAIDAAGPDGQLLTIDVALIRGDSPTRTLVISSGLHGVEGFLGSAVQLQLLNELHQLERAPQANILLLHALNPFGFAWLRRVNEDNVDLNRNFLLPDEPYSGCPAGYRELDRLLNPPRPPSRSELFRIKAAWAILRKGMASLKQAAAGGQYEFPRGLFFGGSEASQTLRILRERLPGWLADTERVVHLDLHTGLGKWATYKLLVEHPLGNQQRVLVKQHFGAAHLELCDTQGVAYQIRGGMGTWCRELCPDVDYTFLGVEFGTYRPLKMIAGLRAENQVHHWASTDDPCNRQTKLRLRELFCPASAAWRESVLRQCKEIIDAGMRAIQSAATTRSPTSEVE